MRKSGLPQLTKNKKIIVFCLSLSVLLHLFLIFSSSIYVKSTTSPFLYGWLKIVGKKDLLPKDKVVNIPSEVIFPLESVQKGYFSLMNQKILLPKEKDSSILSYQQPTDKDFLDREYLGKAGNLCFYLWENKQILPSESKELIPYRAYVSSFGKILFIYPEKLPVDSSENLDLQNYLRKASFFLNENFLWTKLEGVVK